MAAHRVCVVAGCANPIGVPGTARGMCGKHYQRWRASGDPLTSRIDREQTGKPCKVEGCGGKSGYLGMCQTHYRRAKVHGSADGFSPRHRKRFRWIEDHVSHQSDDCLIWPFSVGDHGRGTMTVDRRAMSAPRYMCMLAHGAPPAESMQTAHSCGNGHIGCMNPRHLRWATAAENESDKAMHGTVRRGQKVNTSKLTETDVREIRAIGRSIGLGELSARFGVSKQAIWAIRTRKNWGWLDDGR